MLTPCVNAQEIKKRRKNSLLAGCYPSFPSFLDIIFFLTSLPIPFIDVTSLISWPHLADLFFLLRLSSAVS